MAKNILIIDDDTEVRIMLMELLQREGYDVVSARDGKDGINQMNRHDFDLIVTDILMARCDGFEVLNYFKQMGKMTKVIAISGGGDIEAEEYLKCATALGASYTFKKPFDRREFIQAVQSLVS